MLVSRIGRALVGASLLLASASFAQEFRATITGRVSDPSGVGVPRVKVTARNVATNEENSSETNLLGDYTIPFVKPGTYSVTAEASGFKKAVEDKIELNVNDKRSLNFNLEIGAVTEAVNITDEAPILDADAATRGNVIENRRVTELPLSGRNPFNLANLSTGVIFAGNPQFTRPFDNGDNVNFSINGGLRQTNEYLLDGAPDDAVTNSDAGRTRSQQNIAYIPTVDTTQEFRIVTNFYDAQYGRTGGGVINVTTKSGTNDFHGTGYEFLRRYQLDANTTQNNSSVDSKTGLSRPRYGVDPVTGKNLGGHTLDQYGTAITGPLIIPKVYNGKDKTFFMFGVENYVESTPSPILTNVINNLERNGDFSQSGTTIYDPATTRVNPNYDPTSSDPAKKAQYIRDPFPNNVIPANRINPVGGAIAKAYPTPNTGAANARLNNFIASPNLSEDHFRNWIGRVDQNFGEKERMFFRYAHNRRNQIDNGANGYTGLGRDAQDPLVRVNDNAVVDSVTVLSSRTLLNLRGSLTRYAEAAFRNSVIGFDATTIGFPASFSANRPVAIPPRISVEQYPDFGTRAPRQDLTNTLSFQPSISMFRGRHSMKFGAEVRDIRSNVFGGSFVYGGGQFSFSRNFTQQYPDLTASANDGNAVASLLLGIPSSGIVSYTPALAYRWGYYALYAQDDIKLTQKLTVNLGLRYDIEGSPTERYNRMNRGWNFSSPSPLANVAKNADPANCPSCANLAGGLLFTGTSGESREAFKRDLNNWQPRVGAAYQVFNRTVVRGGFGIFYLPEAQYGGSAGYAIDTQYVATSGGGLAGFQPANTLSNPFPTGLLQPTGSTLGLNTFLGNNVTFANPNRIIPYVYQYSFGVQHQLPKEIKLDVAYVGSRSYHINTGDNQAGNARNINVNSAAQLAQAQANPSYLTAAVPNPFAGQLPGTPFNGATIARGQLLKPFPQFGNVTEQFESTGRLWYDSLQLSVEKRYSSGLTLVGAYTWSKNLEALTYLNDQDLAPSKVLSAQDRPQRLVLSGVYALPFGKGRKFLSGVGRGMNLLVGGWEYNWIGTFQSGTPLSLPGNAYLIGNPVLSGSNNARYFNTCVLNSTGTSAQQPDPATRKFVSCDPASAAFQLRPSNTLRTAPLRTGLIRNPWAKQWDMSLNKSFFITERINAQFRFETFNTFNTPILGAPNTDPTSTNFGLVVNNQSNYPRNVQLGFKLNF